MLSCVARSNTVKTVWYRTRLEMYWYLIGYNIRTLRIISNLMQHQTIVIHSSFEILSSLGPVIFSNPFYVSFIQSHDDISMIKFLHAVFYSLSIFRSIITIIRLLIWLTYSLYLKGQVDLAFEDTFFAKSLFRRYASRKALTIQKWIFRNEAISTKYVLHTSVCTRVCSICE